MRVDKSSLKVEGQRVEFEGRSMKVGESNLKVGGSLQIGFEG